MKNFHDSINQNFQLKDTINYFIDLFTCRKLFAVIPELEADIRNYPNYLARATDEIDLAGSVHWFELPITTGIGDDHYFLNWRVPKLPDGRYLRGVMRMDNTSVFSDGKRLIPQKLLIFQNLEIVDPILLVQFFPLNKNIIIDGNHRYHAKIKDLSPEISVCYLNTDQHVELLVSERQRVLYKIHHNLTFLHHLCLNLVRTDTFNYYSLGNSINFSRLRRLRLKTDYLSYRRYKKLASQKVTRH